MTRYHPELDDPVLTKWIVEFRRTDQEAADIMGFDRETITTHRNRLGLQRNVRPKLTVPYRDTEAGNPPPKERVNPMKLAHRWLGRRLVERNGGYWLDAVPVSLETIMRATNRILKDAGVEMCLHNPRWEP